MTIRVLGPMETGDIRLGARERAVLSALIVRRGVSLTPGEIAEAWWGEARPTTWVQQIRNSVARIRTRLGRDAIETVATEYRLGVDREEIDAVRFERLVSEARAQTLRGEHDRAIDAYGRALALWRGSAYPDLPSWEPGIAEAGRLASIRADVDEELLDERLRIGEHAVLIPEAEQLVREEPLREARWAILALANYRADRQAEGLAVIRAAKARLADELGIEPGDRLRALEQAMLQRDPSLDPPTVVVPASERCPYPGLRAFGPEDHEFFFGRAAQAEALLERVRPGALVVVAGPSGSGKSSLVLAGVVPVLRERGRLVSITHVGWEHAEPKAGVVVVDQAEEAFAPGTEPDDFDRAVASTLDAGVSVVLTIRSSDLDALRALPRIGDLVGQGVLLLGPMSPEAWRAAIEQPARRAGLHVEPGLTEIALRDAGDRAATLPHLSHALRETWRRREGSTLTVAGYEHAAGIAGAIALSAERAYRELDAGDRAVCHALMLRLIERRPDGVDDRRRVAAAPILGDAGRRRVVERLVAARLLSVNDDTVMLAHEAVAKAWPRLDAWLREDSERADAMRSVESGAASWADGGRSPDDLLRGSRLAAVAPWRDALSVDLTEQERLFLDTSITHAEAEILELQERAGRDRKRNRQLRAALWVAASLTVVALVASGVAFTQGRQALTAAEDQRIEALAATSLSLPASDREVAALLAAEIARRWPDDPRGRSALLGAVTASHGLVGRITFPSADFVSGKLIPGTRAAVLIKDFAVSAAGTRPPASISIVDVEDGTTLRTLDAALPPVPTEFGRNVIVSPDSRTVAVQTPLFRDPDDSRTCCKHALTFIDLETGVGIGDTLMLDSRTGEFPVFDDDGRTLFLVHAVTDDPIAVDVRSGRVSTPTPRDPAEYEGMSPQWNSITMLGGLLYIGTGTGLAVYDPASLRQVDQIEVSATDVTSFSLVPDGSGGLLTLGMEGYGRWNPITRALTWERDMHQVQCDFATPVDDGAALICTTWMQGGVKLAMADGTVTGQTFPMLSDWLYAVDPLPETNEIVVVVARSDPSLQRWRMDGAPAISTPVAAGQTVMDGFGAGDTEIITQPTTSARAGEESQRVRWDLESDSAASGPGDWHWADDRIVADRRAPLGLVLEDVDTAQTWTVARADDAETEFSVHDGGNGPLAFAVDAATITPIDPGTGRIAGATIAPAGADLEKHPPAISELSDGERVAVTRWDDERVDMTTVVYSISTGEELARGLYGDVYAAALPGDEFVSASASRLVRSADDLSPLSALPRSATAPDYMEVSDDGRTLMLTTYGKQVALYDVAAGLKLGIDIEVDLVGAPIAPVAFLSSDGLAMVTSSKTGALLWDLSPDALRDAACRLAGRELTELEWQTYFGDDPQTTTCADARS